MRPIDEKILEQILRDFSEWHPPAPPVVRAKNVVFARVRQEAARRLPITQRSFEFLIPQFLILKPRKFMPVIALILAVVLGGGGTVAASQNDTPGDTLYGVKLASERVAEAVVRVTDDATKLNLKIKLAARRAQEIGALQEKLALADAQKKQRLEKKIEETVIRLENRVEGLNNRVETLNEQGTEEALEAAAQMAAQAQVLQGVMASLSQTADLQTELRVQAVEVDAAIEKLKARAGSAEAEIAKKQIVEKGLAQAARGRVKSAENKMQAMSSLREQIVGKIERIDDADKLDLAKREFQRRDTLYQDGVALTREARKALEEQDWADAVEKSSQAFKLFIQFASPLAREARKVDMAEVVPETMAELEGITVGGGLQSLPATVEESEELTEMIDAAKMRKALLKQPEAPATAAPAPGSEIAPGQPETVVQPSRFPADEAARQDALDAQAEARDIMLQYKGRLSVPVKEKVANLVKQAGRAFGLGQYEQASAFYKDVVKLIDEAVSKGAVKEPDGSLPEGAALP
ncbi:hypothetical protein HYW17_05505 [Candidatus Uhrbacteria bacterium]|nr:hypothetical protein [Candidatus Uhrbacteria bacterium]